MVAYGIDKGFMNISYFDLFGIRHIWKEQIWKEK